MELKLVVSIDHAASGRVGGRIFFDPLLLITPGQAFQEIAKPIIKYPFPYSRELTNHRIGLNLPQSHILMRPEIIDVFIDPKIGGRKFSAQFPIGPHWNQMSIGLGELDSVTQWALVRVQRYTSQARIDSFRTIQDCAQWSRLTIESTAAVPAVYQAKAFQSHKSKTESNIHHLRTICQGYRFSPNAANQAVYEDISPRCIGIMDRCSKPVRRAVNAATAPIQNVCVNHCGVYVSVA